MRLFQNSGLYPSYVPRLKTLSAGATGFESLLNVCLNDRYDATHILKPVLDREKWAFFTNGDNEDLQLAWARENGLPADCSLADILLAQIEHHRADVFYNLDPMRYGSDFVRSLPGCVKCSIAWRAAPSFRADFSAYQLMACNFPSILKTYADQGLRTVYLCPAHDPVMDAYADNIERPIDVLFVGGYSQHHQRRARLLKTVAELRQFNIAMCLDVSRVTRVAESPWFRALPLGRYRRPYSVRQVARPPCFGRDLYRTLSESKIVINGAIDMAGNERGNMRCWEALGLGCLMVSDSGVYPEGMHSGEHFQSYADESEVPVLLEAALKNWPASVVIARNGRSMVRSRYSKENQWSAFSSAVAAFLN